MFERFSQAIGAGIRMQTERPRIVDNNVAMEEGKCLWNGEFCEEDANGFSSGGSKAERDCFFSKAVIGRARVAILGRNLR